MHRTLLTALLLFPIAAARADENSVKQAVREKFPNASIESVKPSAFGNLYEVFINRQILYTDEGAQHYFIGRVMDGATDRNLTEERLRQLSAISFESLPFELAFTTVKGSGARKLAVFSDPKCPFCQQLEKDLALVNDVTIYTFLYPIESIHPGATAIARSIWCSQDRTQVWQEWMLRGAAPSASGTCENPVARLQALGDKYRFDATPTLVFADGTVAQGALELRELESTLRETSLRVARKQP